MYFTRRNSYLIRKNSSYCSIVWATPVRPSPWSSTSTSFFVSLQREVRSVATRDPPSRTPRLAVGSSESAEATRCCSTWQSPWPSDDTVEREDVERSNTDEGNPPWVRCCSPGLANESARVAEAPFENEYSAASAERPREKCKVDAQDRRSAHRGRRTSAGNSADDGDDAHRAPDLRVVCTIRSLHRWGERHASRHTTLDDSGSFLDVENSSPGLRWCLRTRFRSTSSPWRSERSTTKRSTRTSTCVDAVGCSSMTFSASHHWTSSAAKWNDAWTDNATGSNNTPGRLGRRDRAAIAGRTWRREDWRARPRRRAARTSRDTATRRRDKDCRAEESNRWRGIECCIIVWANRECDFHVERRTSGLICSWKTSVPSRSRLSRDLTSSSRGRSTANRWSTPRWNGPCSPRSAESSARPRATWCWWSWREWSRWRTGPVSRWIAGEREQWATLWYRSEWISPLLTVPWSRRWRTLHSTTTLASDENLSRRTCPGSGCVRSWARSAIDRSHSGDERDASGTGSFARDIGDWENHWGIAIHSSARTDHRTASIDRTERSDREDIRAGHWCSDWQNTTRSSEETNPTDRRWSERISLAMKKKEKEKEGERYHRSIEHLGLLMQTGEVHSNWTEGFA